MPAMEVDSERLSSLFKSDLKTLRSVAENEGIPRRSSVELLRANIIHKQILDSMDLSWEGIQSKSNAELGDILRVFGVKASGSYKERRQRLWLHLTQDVNRTSVDSLSLMTREELIEYCRKLELPTSGSRMTLSGRVSGVLTSQEKAWGRIKRSLRRNGLTSPLKLDTMRVMTPVTKDHSAVREASRALSEDVADMLRSFSNESHSDDAETMILLSSNPRRFIRMVQTTGIIRGVVWTHESTRFLISLMELRGYPVSDKASLENIHSAARLISDDWSFSEMNPIDSPPLSSLKAKYDEVGIERLRDLIVNIKSGLV